MMKYLYTFKINCNGKRIVGKANKGINVEKNTSGFKKLKLQKGEKRKEKMEKEKQNSTKLQKPKVEAEVFINNKKCD